MRLLVLGGTVFLGRHIVAAAQEAGHRVTLFNRGRHPDVFPAVEQLTGDRDGDLAPLAGRTWDAVIDTSGYVPRIVRRSAEALAAHAGHYTFISTISVYRDFARPGQDETAPTGSLEDPATEEVGGETYGPLKALCEAVVQEAFPGRALVIRPGLIVGPFDPTDRFTYWPWRYARGGEVLAPGPPDRPVQFVDARDLAAWTVRLAAAGAGGVFNATGPQGEPPDGVYTAGALLDACRAAGAPGASTVWADGAFLVAQGVRPWTELPLWIPAEDARMSGILRVDCAAARAAGLTFRPVARTVQDTLDWARRRPPEYAWRAGLPAAREAEVLGAWRAAGRPASRSGRPGGAGRGQTGAQS